MLFLVIPGRHNAVDLQRVSGAEPRPLASAAVQSISEQTGRDGWMESQAGEEVEKDDDFNGWE